MIYYVHLVFCFLFPVYAQYSDFVDNPKPTYGCKYQICTHTVIMYEQTLIDGFAAIVAVCLFVQID